VCWLLDCRTRAGLLFEMRGAGELLGPDQAGVCHDCRSLAHLPYSSGRRTELAEAALAASAWFALSRRARVVQCRRTRPVASIRSARVSHSSTKALEGLAEQPAQVRPSARAPRVDLMTELESTLLGCMSTFVLDSRPPGLSLFAVSSPATS
jgi:hypothetical protein